MSVGDQRQATAALIAILRAHFKHGGMRTSISHQSLSKLKDRENRTTNLSVCSVRLFTSSDRSA